MLLLDDRLLKIEALYAILCTLIESVLERVNCHSVDNNLQQFVPVWDNLLAKEVLVSSSLFLLVLSLNLCSLVLCRFLTNVKKRFWSTFSLPVRTLSVSMISLHCFRFLGWSLLVS